MDKYELVLRKAIHQLDTNFSKLRLEQAVTDAVQLSSEEFILMAFTSPSGKILLVGTDLIPKEPVYTSQCKSELREAKNPDVFRKSTNRCIDKGLYEAISPEVIQTLNSFIQKPGWIENIKVNPFFDYVPTQIVT